MKKGLFIVSALVSMTMLTGCNLNDFINNLSNQMTEATSGEYVDENPIADTAIKLANLSTIFLNVDDEFSVDYVISFEDGSELKVSDYTFSSTNTNVLVVENYVIKAVGNGFAYLNIEGPGLKRVVQQTFFVGPIAGKFTPDGSLGTSNVELDLASDGSFTLDIAEGRYHKEDIAPYTGSGTYSLEAIMFLTLNFGEGQAKPTELLPIENVVTQLGYEAPANQSNVYALLTYEEGVGIKASVYFHNAIITLLNTIN